MLEDYSGRNKRVVSAKRLVLGIDIIDCIYILVTCFTSLVQRRAAYLYFVYPSKPFDPLAGPLTFCGIGAPHDFCEGNTDQHSQPIF